jgi:hypothetical protein
MSPKDGGKGLRRQGYLDYLNHAIEPLAYLSMRPLIFGYVPKMSKAEVILIGFWSLSMFAYLTHLVLSNKDLRHVGESVGNAIQIHIALTMVLPTHKMSLLHILRINSRQVMRLHKWIGRVVVLLLVGHIAFQMPDLIQRGVLLERFVYRTESLWGLFAGIIIIVMWATSLKKVRQKAFEVFFNVHIIAGVLLVVCILLHYHGTLFLLRSGLPLLVYIFDWFARLVYMKPATVLQCERVPGTSIIHVELEVAQAAVRGVLFAPGQYIYMHIASLARFQIHPFSIARWEGNIITLFIRERGDFTGAIVEQGLRKEQVYIDGPYHSLADSSSFWKCDAFVLVAGGVG